MIMKNKSFINDLTKFEQKVYREEHKTNIASLLKQWVVNTLKINKTK